MSSCWRIDSISTVISRFFFAWAPAVANTHALRPGRPSQPPDGSLGPGSRLNARKSVLCQVGVDLAFGSPWARRPSPLEVLVAPARGDHDEDRRGEGEPVQHEQRVRVTADVAEQRPDRGEPDAPGIRARHWARPTPKAPFQPICSIVRRGETRSASQRKTAKTASRIAICHGLPSFFSMKSSPAAPAIAAGTVATATYQATRSSSLRICRRLRLANQAPTKRATSFQK